MHTKTLFVGIALLFRIANADSDGFSLLKLFHSGKLYTDQFENSREYVLIMANDLLGGDDMESFQGKSVMDPQALVLSSGGNLSFFFRWCLRNNHTLSPLTSVILPVNGIDEVPALLKQISMFFTLAKENNITVPTDVPFILVIPFEKISIFANNDNSSTLMTKGELETLVMDKLDPRTKQGFHMESSIFLGFYTGHITNYDPNQSHVWEIYSIHNKTFLNPVNKPLSKLIAGDLEKMSRRKDWNGVLISGLGYATLNKDGVQGIGKYETNIGRDPRSKDKYRLRPSLSSRIMWDFETVLNFTSIVLPPLTYDMGGTNVAFKYYADSFDIIISHFATVAGRLRMLDLLFPTYLDGFVAYFVQPPIYSIRNIHMTPFTPTVWLLIMVSYIFISFSIKSVCRIRSALLDGRYDLDEPFSNKEDELLNQDAHLWVVAAACQQGWHITPKSVAIRMLFLTGLLLGFLCFAAYTATIVSILGKPVVPIDSVEELLENSRNIYIVKTSSVSTLLANGIARRTPKLSPKVQITDLRIAFNHVLFDERGSSCLLDWPETFIEMAHDVLGAPSNTEQLGAFHRPHVEICKHISKFNYKQIPVKAAMWVPKGSPLRNSFNYAILIGFERGFFRKYWNDYNRNTKVRCLEESTKVYALSIFDTSFPFLIILGGMSVSICLLAIEKVHKRRVIMNAVMKMR